MNYRKILKQVIKGYRQEQEAYESISAHNWELEQLIKGRNEEISYLENINRVLSKQTHNVLTQFGVIKNLTEAVGIAIKEGEK